jgi:hypothetical protein
MRQEVAPKPVAVKRDRAAEAGRYNDIMDRLAEAKKIEIESRKKADAALAVLKAKQGILHALEDSAAREGVLTMLDRPQGLRDAFILSEVLAQPVSLRTGGGCPGMMQ